MSRRGRGEGSVFQRADGLWSGSISLGVDANGRRVRRTCYAASKAEVLAKLNGIRADVAGGVLEPTKTTLAKYLDQWLGDITNEVKPNTKLCYASTVRLYVVPNIGSVLLSKILPAHVQGLLRSLEKDDKSPRIRQLTHSVLRVALKKAVRLGLIVRNPVDAVDPPRVVKAPRTVLDGPQCTALLKSLVGTPQHALYTTALGMQMRQGELLGLQWSEVDFTAASIRVEATLIEQAGRIIGRASVKTASGNRTIAMPPVVVSALRAHRVRLLEAGLSGSPWVFPNENGGPFLKSNVSRYLKAALTKAGLPKCRFHDLRHAGATLLIAAGVDVKTVQHRLGHASAVTTLDVYAHASPAKDTEAAGVLNLLLTGPV